MLVCILEPIKFIPSDFKIWVSFYFRSDSNWFFINENISVFYSYHLFIQNQLLDRKLWWLRIYQTFHTTTCAEMQDSRDSGGASQWFARLSSHHVQPRLLLLLHTLWTNNISHSVQNRGSRPMDKANGKKYFLPISRTRGGLKRRYSYLSTVVTPKRRHY